ncbi:MAG: hypothetical protein RSF42_07135 [Comamonas sp.]
MTYRTSTYTSRELRRLQAKRQRTTSQPRRIPKGTGQEGIARLNDCLPYDPGDTTADHIKTREAFARVADGTASKDDFDRVVVALNLARIRAGQIDQGLCDEVGTAQAALERCKQRYLQIRLRRPRPASHADWPRPPRSHHGRQQPQANGASPTTNAPQPAAHAQPT